MSEYLIQKETLDNIAEAVNHKAGTQVAMTPAEMVTAINNIVGDFPIPGFKIAKGTFQPTTTSGSFTINHNLGVIPFMVLVIPTNNIYSQGNYNLGGCTIFAPKPTNSYFSIRFYSNSAYPVYTHKPSTDVNDNPETTYAHNFTTTTFTYSASVSFPLLNTEYSYIAVGFENISSNQESKQLLGITNQESRGG